MVEHSSELAAWRRGGGLAVAPWEREGGCWRCCSRGASPLSRLARPPVRAGLGRRRARFRRREQTAGLFRRLGGGLGYSHRGVDMEVQKYCFRTVHRVEKYCLRTRPDNHSLRHGWCLPDTFTLYRNPSSSVNSILLCLRLLPVPRDNDHFLRTGTGPDHFLLRPVKNRTVARARATGPAAKHAPHRTRTYSSYTTPTPPCSVRPVHHNSHVHRPSPTAPLEMEAPACRFVSLLALCSLASMAVMLGCYGPVVEVAVGPGCSRLVQASSVFVQGIEVSVEARAQGDGGLVLYGLAGAPPLDTPAEWSEARRVVVPANSHRQWAYFLNKGARIEAAYTVKSDTDVPYPLRIIIAQGSESFVQCTEIPPVQNSALPWRLVQGNGTIEQTINLSSEYFVTVCNSNDHQDITVQLDFRIRALFYNTSGAYYRCSPGHGLCTYRLPFLGQNVAVLSSGYEEILESDAVQQVKLSYEPRWIAYVVGSAILAAALMLLYEILNMLFGACAGGGDPERRTPLLVTDKDDDGASLGSSYDSVSHDGGSDDPEEERGGDGGCVLCCDAPKGCFFLPCGHSATCYPCGARIVAENGCCPFCRRKLKKVRRIFTV
ncbi:hypothetical protein BS78_09G206900 [Paspalum vaginatum]|nr:hypothetical protein BS78_09G206900 [Paspalum vaginatum]